MKTKASIAVSALVLLAACATEYQPNGLMGGYSDELLTENTALISFQGNGYTSKIKTRRFALQRAAEFTAEQGYDYFFIEDGESEVQTFTTPSSVNCNSFGYSVNCQNFGGYNVRSPVTSVVIRMFKGKAPNKPGYFKASELLPVNLEVTDQPNTKK